MNLKSSLVLLTSATLLTGWASAELPKKMPIGRYSGLWVNSPFTSKPPPPGPMVEGNPMEDYALIGVSPIAHGYRVTLINKKNPEERLVVDSDNPASKFKIEKVTRKAGDPLGTVVSLRSDKMVGTVAYDEKLLTLAAPPKPAAGQQNPNQPPGAQPGQPQLQNGQQRQPRPRVVPPPQGAPGAQGQPGVQGQQQGQQLGQQQGQPQPQQQLQQAPQVQQGQPGQQNNTNRPRRGRN